MRVHKDSSCAKCPDTAVRSGIKGMTLFKLSALLICGKSSIIIYFRTHFSWVWGEGLNTELINAFLLLSLCTVLAPWHCATGTSCLFCQKPKVVFLMFRRDLHFLIIIISDKQFLWFQDVWGCHSWEGWVTVQTVRNCIFPVHHHSRRCHTRCWEPPLCSQPVFHHGALAGTC